MVLGALGWALRPGLSGQTSVGGQTAITLAQAIAGTGWTGNGPEGSGSQAPKQPANKTTQSRKASGQTVELPP